MSRVYLKPEEIEKKSMEIIEKKLVNLSCSSFEKEIIKRVIHTTVDFTYVKSIIFHPDAIKSGIKALRSGENIITDVQMVKVGIRQYELENFGNKIYCFLAKKKISPNSPIPRAVLGIKKAISYLNNSIVVIGNAPTALFALIDLVQKNEVKPALIIGTPVGFVDAKESKKELSKLKAPYITNYGEKGGSTVACAIINALIKLAIK